MTMSVVNILTEILHAHRRIIDMKHIAWTIGLKAGSDYLDGPRELERCQTSTFSDMVMLHIELDSKAYNNILVNIVCST